MKKHLFGSFTVIALLLLTQTQAQLKKGEKMLGATFSISTEKMEHGDNYETQKAFQFGVAPQLAFGLGKNWIAGISLGYTHAKATGELYDDEIVANAFAAGAFLRKFHGFNDQFGIFGQFNLGAGFGKGERSTTNGPEYESDITMLSAIVQPGFYFRPNKSILLEAVFGNIGYTSTKTDYDSGVFLDTKRNKFEFSLTEALAIGFKVIL
jgi:hypothetical protein